MDIFQNSQQLRIESSQVLKELSLLEKLKKLGRVRIVGSLALDLMVYKDIDIEVVVNKLNRHLISQMVGELTSVDLRRIDFSLIDNISNPKEKFPKGIYMGIKYHLGSDWVSNFSKNEQTWKIDIWFVDSENARSLKVTEEIKAKLNDKNRKTILEIKSHSYKDENYRKMFRALDIYKAVLDEGITTLKEFQEYLTIKKIT